MRLAASALSAASGLILLGLALFGRPDAYVREARRQWTVLWQPEPAVPDGPMAAQVQALQQQVMQLRDQIAATHPADQPEVPPAAVAPAVPEPAVPMPAAAEPAAPAPATATILRAAPEPPARVEGPAPVVVVTVPERHEFVKPLPAPRPRQEASAAKPDADTTEAVLARLRQHLAPPAAPVSAAPPIALQPVIPQPSQVSGAAAPNPEPARADPVHERLAFARAALLNGAMADAVRMLQQAQLQLVFRPVTPDNNEPAAAGQGAADVARALAALGGNDPRRGLMFVERAMSDVSGGITGWQPPPASPVGGYAPAYPSR